LAEWVRAFSLEAILLLLERPMRGVDCGKLADLRSAVTQCQARGTAVLWLALETDPEASELVVSPAVARYTIREQSLIKS
jgi:ABC-type sugar transport system ATPase subunit